LVSYEKGINFFIKLITGRHPEWREGVLPLLPTPQTEIKNILPDSPSSQNALLNSTHIVEWNFKK
jgi:hypothetical protein